MSRAQAGSAVAPGVAGIGVAAISPWIFGLMVDAGTGRSARTGVIWRLRRMPEAIKPAGGKR